MKYLSVLDRNKEILCRTELKPWATNDSDLAKSYNCTTFSISIGKEKNYKNRKDQKAVSQAWKFS